MDAIDQFLFEASETKLDNKKSTKCIISYGDKFLILRRNMGMAGEGSWDLAGGLVDEGETPLQAIEREIEEETTLRVKDIKSKKIVTVHLPGQATMKTNIYTATAKNDDVYLPLSIHNREKFAWSRKPKPEHSEFKWVKWEDQVEDLDMIPEYKEALIKELKTRSV